MMRHRVLCLLLTAKNPYPTLMKVERDMKVVHEVLAKTFVLVLIEGVSLTYKGARVKPNKTNKSGEQIK